MLGRGPYKQEQSGTHLGRVPNNHLPHLKHLKSLLELAARMMPLPGRLEFLLAEHTIPHHTGRVPAYIALPLVTRTPSVMPHALCMSCTSDAPGTLPCSALPGRKATKSAPGTFMR